MSYPYTAMILVLVDCGTLILGGMLATFLIRAQYLFYLSIGCFVIGVPILLFKTPFTDPTLYWVTHVLIGLSFGLFKFIYLVALIDQNDRRYIKFIVAFFLFTESICYLIVYTFTPNTDTVEKIWNLNYARLALAGFGAILVVIGCFLKLFEKDTEVIEIYGIIQFFRQRRFAANLDHSILNNTETVDFRKVIISISKSVIVFFLLIPYGICDSQEFYAYEFQSNSLNQSNLLFNHFKSNFWCNTISAFTVMAALLILFAVRFCNENKFDAIYSNIKTKIILGNSLMIISTLICGALETYRLSMLWTDNNSTLTPNYKNVIIDNTTYHVVDISVFWMVPQNILLSFSEVLIVPTCIEYVIDKSEKSTKYLSIVLVFSAVNIGGISDLISMSMDFKGLFRTEFDSPGKFIHRLDHVLYIISSISVVSLVVSVMLMTRFERYFSTSKNPQ